MMMKMIEYATQGKAGATITEDDDDDDNEDDYDDDNVDGDDDDDGIGDDDDRICDPGQGQRHNH